MSTPSNPSYLFQSRHGIYYFRVRIPFMIKSRYNASQNEVRKSLNTRSIVVARRRARRLWVQMEDTDYMPNVDELERQMSESNRGRQLLKSYLIASIRSWDTGIPENRNVAAAMYFDDYDMETEVDPLCKSQRGDQAISVSSINRLVKGWCDDVGLKGNYGSHTLRKTWGYHQRMAGTDIPTLMTMFNHSTQKQTLDYLCIQAEEIEDAYLKVNL